MSRISRQELDEAGVRGKAIRAGVLFKMQSDYLTWSPEYKALQGSLADLYSSIPDQYVDQFMCWVQEVRQAVAEVNY